jgi:O-methyltransferase involved in polyketide biosynthesis
VDFGRESLAAGLSRAGFDFSAPAHVARPGVTPYLVRETVIATFRFLAASLARGSELIFDYAEPVHEGDPVNRARFAALAARVAQAGEPFRCVFGPAELRTILNETGFAETIDLYAVALNAHLFSARSDGLRIGGHGHLLHARW